MSKFSSLKSQNISRFNDVHIFLSFIESLEREHLSTNQIFTEYPKPIKIMRGLFFVHLYACIEKTFNELVQRTIQLIEYECRANNHLLINLNLISLYPKLQSLKSCGKEKFITKGLDLLMHIENQNKISLSETVLCDKLQNIWPETVEQILSIFGIEEFTLNNQQRALLSEITDHRNSIAHGRTDPVSIGEKQHCNILRKKHNQVQQMISEIIDLFDNYITNICYIRNELRPNYITNNISS